MKFILIYALVLLSGQNEFISDCRQAYSQQDEERILHLLDKLESKSNKTKEEVCYEAVFLCLKANFSVNPYTKLTSFKEGYGKLNELIKVQSSNVEFRFHRYMIETQAPSFLIENSHVKEDRSFIKENLKEDEALYSLIIQRI